MEFSEFLMITLGVSSDFKLDKIEKIDEPQKEIKIYLKYKFDKCIIDSKSYTIYDYAVEREWQHLNWFQYKCTIVCRLPRYLDSDKKVKTLIPSFANERKGYTILFASAIIEALQEIKVQKTTAKIFKTTDYIVRSIMEEAVEHGLKNRGKIKNLINVSIDEKAFCQGHNYATILIDSDKNYVVDLVPGRKEDDLKALFFNISEEKTQPQLKRVNMDMWRAYMNVIEEIAPDAKIVHDKYHMFEKLGQAVDKTRKQEVATQPILLKQKYNVLKNEENRTEKQKEIFKQIEASNLQTARVWHIKENFKSLFLPEAKNNIEQLFNEWISNARTIKNQFLDNVVDTFLKHTKGIINAFLTNTNSGKHENTNGKIQSVIAKAKGFINYERFKINVLFYFGNLQLLPQKI